ncbi:Asp-tRNA(Asn)/Glu-tRNA(Gln) amidotransferase subunit GatC [Patescibacteria group bacterium AH-259-L07]|nr:Asp-tRNA(Asn)/Glu-tRNA(Gln) amidotransferase subunit GatC [Patescibacteria group bacterium AH-259-L07]
MISKSDVQHIALLARLKLTPQEVKTYQKQLGAILDYIGQLKKVNTQKIPPQTGGTQLKNVLREDTAQKTSKEVREKLLENAPLREGDYIKTRAVFERKNKKSR